MRRQNFILEKIKKTTGRPWFFISLAIMVLSLCLYHGIDLGSAYHSKEKAHILLSTLAFSILAISALLASVLALQEHFLRQKQYFSLFAFLPPLVVMESLLFQILSLGFIVLTLVLITSVWSFNPELILRLWPKGLVALLAWMILAMLLIGRYHFGWRGQQAVRWTLSGVAVLMLTYFGSEFLIFCVS